MARVSEAKPDVINVGTGFSSTIADMRGLLSPVAGLAPGLIIPYPGYGGYANLFCDGVRHSWKSYHDYETVWLIGGDIQCV